MLQCNYYFTKEWKTANFTPYFSDSGCQIEETQVEQVQLTMEGDEPHAGKLMSWWVDEMSFRAYRAFYMDSQAF